MRILKFRSCVNQAIVVKIKQKKYIVYLTRKDGCDIIKIVNYTNFNEKLSQILYTFKNSSFVNLAYDGKYIYISHHDLESKIIKCKIDFENERFHFKFVKEIQLPSSKSQIQSIVSSSSGKIAIFDMYDGNIYEIENDELKYVRCTRDGCGITHQQLYYKNDEVHSNFDTKPWHITDKILKEYECVIKDKSIRLICYSESTQETIFCLSNALVFEKNGMFNGFILFETRKIINIASYISSGKEYLVLCCSKGEVITLTQRDVYIMKQKSLKEITKVRDKKIKIIQMIAYCSGSEEEVLFRFAQDFKNRGLEMYDDIKELKDSGLTGKDALNEYEFMLK